MQFFIDSANITEIQQALDWGMCDGVTTNPSLIAREGKPFKDVVKLICEKVSGPISLETVADRWEEMVEEGKRLADISPQVVVKLPMCTEALKATRILAEASIPVNMTLCFSPLQGLMAAKAGAAYISPFIGRLDDISHDGLELIAQLVQIYDNYDFDTQVLAASIRHPRHAIECALLGADVATIPFSVLKQFSSHPLTDSGIEKFNQDWAKVPVA